MWQRMHVKLGDGMSSLSRSNAVIRENKMPLVVNREIFCKGNSNKSIQRQVTA